MPTNREADDKPPPVKVRLSQRVWAGWRRPDVLDVAGEVCCRVFVAPPRKLQNSLQYDPYARKLSLKQRGNIQANRPENSVSGGG
jgi:hypothetical protein